MMLFLIWIGGLVFRQKLIQISTLFTYSRILGSYGYSSSFGNLQPYTKYLPISQSAKLDLCNPFLSLIITSQTLCSLYLILSLVFHKKINNTQHSSLLSIVELITISNLRGKIRVHWRQFDTF